MAHDEHAAERAVVVNTKGFADPDGPMRHFRRKRRARHLVRFAPQRRSW